jgi:antitoxin ParD1/3/4
MNGKTVGERRLIELVEEGLSSPIEPDDPAFWQKRREALRRAIAKKSSKRSP